jgi:hypothetical protein
MWLPAWRYGGRACLLACMWVPACEHVVPAGLHCCLYACLFCCLYVCLMNGTACLAWPVLPEFLPGLACSAF